MAAPAPKVRRAVAANVRAERGRARWTQVELARRLGWPVKRIIRIESSGKAHVEELVLVGRALRCGLRRLLDGLLEG